MLDAADVLVDRHPVVGALVDHGFAVVGAGVARVVPGRIDEGVHGVGFAPRRLAAFRAGAIHEIGALVERIAGAVGHAVLRQHHRQVLVGHRHVAAGRAMDDRDRAAPVALARNAPVAQAVEHLLLAEAFGLEVGGDGVDRLRVVQAVVFAGVYADAVFLVGIPFLPGVGAERLARDLDDLLDRQPIFFGEMEIALVMRRHRHHRAFAVAHQHVVADPDLDFLAGQRMRRRKCRSACLSFPSSPCRLPSRSRACIRR